MDKQPTYPQNFNPTFLNFIEDLLKTNAFEVIPLAGDASNRKYYRVVHDDRSSVLMAWDPFEDIQNYPFLSVLSHFKKHNVFVPEVIGMAPPLGLVLLEDLGDLTLERKFWENQNQSTSLPFYFQAMDELIKIHYVCSADRSPCSAFNIQFDTEKLLWEMNYGYEHLLQKLCAADLNAEDEKELKRIFIDICQKLDREDKYIAHRDYHSRNLMIKFGKMRVIDFQDARMGPIQYDIVSLIQDAYVSLNEEVSKQIIDYYLLQRADHIKDRLSRDQFDEIYHLQVIQRCFKACGSFSSFYNARDDRRYLKYIQPALKSVAKSLSRFPDYKKFHSLLIDLNLLETDFEALCTR
jgi:aminoglycoside/choline kinase family phosphotransferase